MEKKERRKIFLIVGAFVLFSVLGINLYANFADKEITVTDQIQLVVAGGALFGITINVIFSNKSSSKIDHFSDDFYEVKTDVSDLKVKVEKIDIKVIKIDENQQAMERGFFDISEIIKHKNKIVEIVRKIKTNTQKLVNKEPEIDKNTKNLIFKIANGVSLIVRNQYEDGFKEFNTEFYKCEIENHISAIYKQFNGYFGNEFCKKCKNVIGNNLNVYIKELDLIKNIDNGDRRIKFEDLTLNFTDLTTNHILKISEKIAS